jgi:hypothetical protein
MAAPFDCETFLTSENDGIFTRSEQSVIFVAFHAWTHVVVNHIYAAVITHVEYEINIASQHRSDLYRGKHFMLSMHLTVCVHHEPTCLVTLNTQNSLHNLNLNNYQRTVLNNKHLSSKACSFWIKAPHLQPFGKYISLQNYCPEIIITFTRLCTKINSIRSH